MSWIDKIQEAIDYIEQHLHDELTIESIGNAINYAPSSFQSLFSAMTGYSISEYIRLRRLTCALCDIEDGRVSITDLAHEYGYETVEAFSKAFKRLFGYAPSKLLHSNSEIKKFLPIYIEYKLRGGFSMKKNIIPSLQKVDWSDTTRQNEFVWSVISALNAIGENLDYDYVCAVSGCSFRTFFDKKDYESDSFNHGNYNITFAMWTIEHTFNMLGYKATVHKRSDFETDRTLIINSIDKGVPVLITHGIIDTSDCCVISGYDNDGDVILGYSAFMCCSKDFNEDKSGYFRKTDWHNQGYFSDGRGAIIIIDKKTKLPSKQDIYKDTLRIAARLIKGEYEQEQYMGLSAHTYYANSLMNVKSKNISKAYFNILCNNKMYIDKAFASSFFNDNDNVVLAEIYEKISKLANDLHNIIPHDFKHKDYLSNKHIVLEFCHKILSIRDLEKQALDIMEEELH